MRDRVVTVTGGGSGIGRAAVLLAAERGARVVALDIDGESAEAVSEEARGRGAAEALGLTCDVTQEREVEAAMAEAERRLGPLYGVFANAGTDIGGLVHELELQTWERVLRTNLTGVFLTCKHALRAMIATGTSGSIVCTSSPAAVVSFSAGGVGAYAASKGGVSALVRCMSLDYARYGIRVNAIMPGPTETRLMWANVPEEDRDRMRGVINSEVPLGRLARAEEIAHAALWLLSDDASYVTGSHLVCEGGFLSKASISV
jgi:NAD(P)-dependent dehydrogenase (short-subunit alcohol dehydrogenase family)